MSTSGLWPSQFGVALFNLALRNEQEITDAWELVHQPRTVMMVFPWELRDAKDRIQLAAAEHGMLLNRC